MNTATAELDVRPMPPPVRHPTIFQRFDGLAPGDGFVLVNDHDPKPLLYTFQNERPARFDWSYLEAGPATWRVEIKRRSAEDPRGVSEYLQGDHRRLDAILEEVKIEARQGRFTQAKAAFGTFTCGLKRHIAMEEQILFPAFEAATGQRQGPTMVMRMEHVEIQRFLEEAEAALAGSNAARFDSAAGGLLAVLGEHNMKEEHILYPTCDQVAGSDRARDEIVRKMQTI